MKVAIVLIAYQCLILVAAVNAHTERIGIYINQLVSVTTSTTSIKHFNYRQFTESES